MDEVNINKYLGQFNPMLIAPVLSAVVGAILVFVFGFKRPNEPRFQSSSSLDSLKKSKRKGNTVKGTENTIQSSKQQNASSAKVNSGKKVSDATATVTSKKGATNEKQNNNNNTSSNNNNNNNNINKKKTDEKKSENGSPVKKAANKKMGKETAAPANKKSKMNKNNLSEIKDVKPADFDDGGWFTVQSKSTKQKNKVDDLGATQTDNSSPKAQATRNKPAKSAKAETKQLTPQAIVKELNNTVENSVENSVVEQVAVEPSSNETVVVDAPAAPVAPAAPAVEVIAEPEVVAVNEVADAVTVTAATVQPVEKKVAAPAQTPAAEVNAGTESAIAFDELGEWTDIKPDRKKGNKKKSRKD